MADKSSLEKSPEEREWEEGGEGELSARFEQGADNVADVEPVNNNNKKIIKYMKFLSLPKMVTRNAL